MKLAVRKEPGHIPGSGFHYHLFPIEMNGPEGMHELAFKMMGHVIIEVDDERGKELIKDAKLALKHQVEIALLTDAAEKATT